MIKYRKPTESRNPEFNQRDAELRRLTDNYQIVFNNIESALAGISEKLLEAGVEYEIPDIYRR